MTSTCSYKRRRVAWVATVAIALLSVHVRAQVEAASTSEVLQLKSKLQQLEQEMNQLKEQISAIEQAPHSNGAQTTPTAAGRPSPEQTAPPPQDEQQKNSIDLYGFVMLDSGYDFKTNNPDWFDVMRPTQLPSFRGQFAPDGKVYFGVRQTRFGVKTSTPTSLGNLKTQFEFELFGTGVDAGQTTFRLRHSASIA